MYTSYLCTRTIQKLLVLYVKFVWLSGPRLKVEKSMGRMVKRSPTPVPDRAVDHA